MKKLICAAVLAVSLASCGTVVKNPLTPSVVYNMENAYGIAQAAAVTYGKLPRCGGTVKTLCSKASVVVSLASYDQKARIALTALQAFAQNPANYPGLTYAGLLSAAQSAISAFQSIEATNGVG